MDTPIPHLGRRRAIALLVPLALALGCSSGSGAPSPEPTGTAATAPAPSDAPEDDTSTPVGPTEVAIVSHLPEVDLDWESSELPLPEPAPLSVQIAAIAEGASGLRVVGFGWYAPPRNQIVMTWERRDDGSWTRTDLEVGQGSSMYQVVATGRGLFGLGSETTAAGFVPVLWRERSGTWATVPPPADLGTEGVSYLDLAANEVGVAIAATRESYVPSQPASFEAGGVLIEMNQATGAIVVRDPDTRQPLWWGSDRDVYGGEDGQRIFDPETGEVLAVIPWEVLSQAAPQWSPLPIPVAPPDEPISVEWEGYRLETWDRDGRYRVTRLADGIVVADGSLDDFYRGPAPRFVDPASGEEIASFSWAEWDELVANATTEPEEHEPHPSEHLVLFSVDGDHWTAHELGAGTDTQIESLSALADRFLVEVVDHHDANARRLTYESTDGTNWVEVAATMDAENTYRYGTVAAGPALSALSESEAGQRIVTSNDGRTWATELLLPAQPDGDPAFLDSLAGGPTGLVALVTRHAAVLESPLEITIGRLTATFDDGDSAMRVTAADGTVLLDVGWAEIDDLALGGEFRYGAREGRATVLLDGEGNPLMTIPDKVVEEAYAARDKEVAAATFRSLLLRRDGRWTEALAPAMNAPHQVALLGDRVVVASGSEDMEFESHQTPEATVHIGTWP